MPDRAVSSTTETDDGADAGSSPAEAAAPAPTRQTGGEAPSGRNGRDGRDGRNGRTARPWSGRSRSAGAGSADPAEAPDPRDGLDPAGRRRLRRGWWTGAVPALGAYLWMLTMGRADLFQVHYFDDFFDAQARSFMDGRLDVPYEVAGFEGFLIDGKTYIYFGPVPALLRIPVLAVTDRFDGRLTILSMLLAAVVLAAATFRLSCSLRGVVRGTSPVGRREPLATGLVAVVTLLAPPFFLASQAFVHHEATLWGIALTVAAFDAVLRWQRLPTTRGLVVAGALVLAAVMSRQSLGQGPLVALALSGLAVALAQARAERPDAPVWSTWLRAARSPRRLACEIACLVPFVAVLGLNYAKFGTLLSPPSDKHNFSLFSAHRVEVLEANDGSLFGLHFVPSTLKQYFRPDGIDVRLDMPWIDFPRLGPSAVGETVFDKLDWTSSVPASAPLLTALTIAALVWMVRTRRQRRGGPWLAPLMVGALVGGLGVIAIGHIANRYLTDLYPLVLIPGLVGFHLVLRGWRRWAPRTRRVAAVGLGGLAVLGLAVNVALALEYQRERGPNVPESVRADWSSLRASLPGSYEPLEVSPAAPWLPESAFDSRMAVVGECDGLYVRFEDEWRGLERGPAVGVYDLRVDLDDLPAEERVPLITLGDGPTRSVVAIRRVGDGLVRVDVSRLTGTSGGWDLGFPVAAEGEVIVRADGDFRERDRDVSIDDEVAHSGPLPTDTEMPRVGRAPPGLGTAVAFPGDIELLEPDMSLCDRAGQLEDPEDAAAP